MRSFRLVGIGIAGTLIFVVAVVNLFGQDREQQRAAAIPAQQIVKARPVPPDGCDLAGAIPNCKAEMAKLIAEQTLHPPEHAAVNSSKRAEVISFTATNLFEAYDNNEVSTDIELKGKIVEVTGRVQSVDKDVFDNIRVGLVTPNQFMSASMHVGESEEAKTAALQKGQFVVFRCLKMKRWVGSPSGDDCVLVSAQ
jgi:hypothetical protein